MLPLLPSAPPFSPDCRARADAEVFIDPLSTPQLVYSPFLPAPDSRWWTPLPSVSPDMLGTPVLSDWDVETRTLRIRILRCTSGQGRAGEKGEGEGRVEGRDLSEESVGLEVDAGLERAFCSRRLMVDRAHQVRRHGLPDPDASVRARSGTKGAREDVGRGLSPPELSLLSLFFR
jgi:hypothetical protein